MVDHIAWQLERFRAHPDDVAVVWRDREVSYGDLVTLFGEWQERLRQHGVSPGDAVGVIGDYSPQAIAALLALVDLRCIVVPLSRDSRDQHDEFFRIAELDSVFELDEHDVASYRHLGLRAGHELLEQVRADATAGLVLFSSGSTGKPKGILHSLPPLLAKFRTLRKNWRTINFLLFDHIGGVNTMFYTLANLGCTIVPENRTVSAVCRAIERHRVELLPTSPSFLNLLLLERAAASHDLSSLKVVTYGTEVMPERTLALATEALPQARFQQTYGLSELGILRSKSKSNESLMVKVGGEDYETRVVDGTLRIRARSSMVGYLNAPSPFDEDGWFNTGDSVIEEDGYYRILGRESDIINVGGQKVFPAEVERVIAELDGVIDAAVHGEPHLLLGQVVVATVQMDDPAPAREMKRRINALAKGRLQPYMIPTRVDVTTETPVNYRFKKIRRGKAAS